MNLDTTFDSLFIHGNIDKNLFSSTRVYTDQLVGIRSLTSGLNLKENVEDMPIIIEKEQISRKKSD